MNLKYEKCLRKQMVCNFVSTYNMVYLFAHILYYNHCFYSLIKTFSWC